MKNFNFKSYLYLVIVVSLSIVQISSLQSMEVGEGARHPFKEPKKYLKEMDKSLKEAQEQEKFFKKKLDEAGDEENRKNYDELYKDANERVTALADLRTDYRTNYNKFTKATDKKSQQEFLEEGLEIVANVDGYKKEIVDNKAKIEKLKGTLTKQLKDVLEGIVKKKPTKEIDLDIDLTVITQKNKTDFNKLLKESALLKKDRIKKLEALASRMILESGSRLNEVLGSEFDESAQRLQQNFMKVIKKGDAKEVRSGLVAALKGYGDKIDLPLHRNIKVQKPEVQMQLLDVEFEAMDENYQKVLGAIKKLGGKTEFPEKISVGALGVFSDDLVAQEQAVGVPVG